MTNNDFLPLGSVDVDKLQAEIDQRRKESFSWTFDELAEVIDMTRVGLIYKLQEKRRFRLSELMALAGRLGVGYKMFLKNDSQSDTAASRKLDTARPAM